MNPTMFYGRRKTYPNANNAEEQSDESAFSDSDDDPDYLPTRPTPRVPLQDNSSDYSSSDGEESDNASPPSDPGTRSPAWKNIQVESVPDNQIPIWKSALPDSDGIMTPSDYFNYFFGAGLFDHIVYESNLFSIQKNPGKPLKLNKPDLEKFIGCCMWMSVIKLPRSRMYWANQTRISQVADVMPRDRWESIKASLHFNDNTNIPSADDPSRDRLFKIRPIIDYLLPKFQCLPQDQTLCIDEQMVPFKGKSGLKQYIPKKPHKWGYKIFVLCDTKGIVYNFEIYTGKINPVAGYPDLGASANIVIQLSQVVEKQANYLLYFDNWFSSLKLFAQLAKEGIYALGTVRPNRLPGCRFSHDTVMKKRGRGTFEEKELSIEGTSIRAVKWYDNRGVVLASTFAKARPVGAIQRWDRTKTQKVQVGYPFIVKQYNTFMGGVDILDAYLAYYRTHIRSKKYYLRLFFHLLDLAVVNSWLLYRRDCDSLAVPRHKQKDQLAFKLALASYLCKHGKIASGEKRGRPSSIQREYQNKKKRGPTKPIPEVEIRRDQTGHFPVVMETRQRCKRPSCKGQTVFKCIKCQVHLCLNKNSNCFMEFHE